MRSPLARLDEIAAYVGMSESTIRDQRHRGVGIGALAIRVGRHLRWRWSDVDEWLDTQLAARGNGKGAA